MTAASPGSWLKALPLCGLLRPRGGCQSSYFRKASGSLWLKPQRTKEEEAWDLFPAVPLALCNP